MKKLVAFLIFSFCLVLTAECQQTKLITKTISTADTTAFVNVPSKIKAFQYSYKENSGVTAGKLFFEGTVNGDFVKLDSMALADTSIVQTKVFLLTGTNYLSYRFRCTNTSNASAALKVGWLRRVDD